MSGAARQIARTFVLLLAGIGTVMLAACHEEGDVRVISLSFSGVRAFDASQLQKVVATRSGSVLPWGRKRFFDRTAFEADLKRLTAFYADRGFPDARVAGVDITFNEKKDGVRLRIRIEEGAPVVVEQVRFEGFDDLPASARSMLESLPLKSGERRDRDLVRATRDGAVRIFRNNGFPAAVVDATERPGATPASVVVSYFGDPGPPMTFGQVTVTGVEHVDESVVRREVAFAPGQPYDERLVMKTQRRLTRLDLLELAAVTPRVDAPEGGAVPVRITVAEGKQRRLKLGAGYGSEELVRGSVAWQHLNMFGGARLFTADAKYSAIDRGVRVSLTEPYLMRSGLSLTVGGDRWVTSELTYDSKTYGGRTTLTYQFDRATNPSRQPVHYRTNLTYAYDYLRYGIKPDALSDHARREERIALGLDPDTGRARGTLATVEIDVERIALDSAADPRLGTASSFHVEFASPMLAGTYRYTEYGADVRGFVAVGRAVVAARVRASTIASADPLSVPFAKRYFLGGSASLRGWGRFQVSPLNEDGLPVGGRSVVEASTELRVPLRGALGGVLFVDAGNVWPDSGAIDWGRLRWDAGAGLRYRTPVGVLRLDAGRQLTPIPGLVVNGKPATRLWRFHFNLGQSF